jgi:two-component system response regulator GlrR
LRSSSRARGSRNPPSSLLLLDDDDDFRTALADNLRDDGFRVLEFRTPAQLPAIDELGEIGAVITDDQMPGEDGLTFTDRFHEKHPSVPVVMVTAFMTHYLEAQLTLRKFTRVLTKPFDYEVLLDLLKRLRCTASRPPE